jgi:hypothetical protein
MSRIKANYKSRITAQKKVKDREEKNHHSVTKSMTVQQETLEKGKNLA